MTESDDDDGAAGDDWHDRKSARMVELLGEAHSRMMHAAIPYAMGGGLDLYYFPHGIPGTGIATKELSDAPGEGSANEVYENYELVMFTRQSVDLEQANNDEHPFGKIHRRINSILNSVAPYSAEAELNPRETCEFPDDFEDDTIAGACLIFDGYPSFHPRKPSEFGLLLVMEVFRGEMEFARKRGGAKLIERLKEKGCYPYSDLDREPVV